MTQILKNDNVHPKIIEGKLFLIDLDSAMVMELNEVGALIWNSISQSKSIEDIPEKITQEYEVDLPQAKQDVSEFFKELKRCGLITLKETL